MWFLLYKLKSLKHSLFRKTVSGVYMKSNIGPPSEEGGLYLGRSRGLPGSGGHVFSLGRNPVTLRVSALGNSRSPWKSQNRTLCVPPLWSEPLTCNPISPTTTTTTPSMVGGGWGSCLGVELILQPSAPERPLVGPGG